MWTAIRMREKKVVFRTSEKKRSFIINGIAQENEVRKPLVDFLGCVRADFFANLEKMVGSGLWWCWNWKLHASIEIKNLRKHSAVDHSF